jgi:hypothetical protein
LPETLFPFTLSLSKGESLWRMLNCNPYQRFSTGEAGFALIRNVAGCTSAGSVLLRRRGKEILLLVSE